MSEAVRALEPVDPNSDGEGPHPPAPAPHTTRARAIVGWAAVLGVLLLLLGRTGSPDEPPPFEPIPAGANLQPLATPIEPTPTTLPRAASVTEPVVSPAVVAFEEFVAQVNRGDARTVVELMADELPDVVGIGTAEYPHLPTAARLWVDGQLDHESVEGFVRYVATLPGSVLVSGCEAFADGPRVVVAACAYATTGGVLLPLGQEPETGRLFGIMVDAKVAGLVRRGEVDLDLWRRFASWTALNHPEVQVGEPGEADEEWFLDPVYSGDSAREYGAIAGEMARATASETVVG